MQKHKDLMQCGKLLTTELTI